MESLKNYHKLLGKLLAGKKLRYKKHYIYLTETDGVIRLVYDLKFGEDVMVIDVPGGWHEFLLQYKDG